MHACMHVCMYVCIDVCMYVLMYVCMYEIKTKFLIESYTPVVELPLFHLAVIDRGI